MDNVTKTTVYVPVTIEKVYWQNNNVLVKTKTGLVMHIKRNDYLTYDEMIAALALAMLRTTEDAETDDGK